MKFIEESRFELEKEYRQNWSEGYQSAFKKIFQLDDGRIIYIGVGFSQGIWNMNNKEIELCCGDVDYMRYDPYYRICRDFSGEICQLDNSILVLEYRYMMICYDIITGKIICQSKSDSVNSICPISENEFYSANDKGIVTRWKYENAKLDKCKSDINDAKIIFGLNDRRFVTFNGKEIKIIGKETIILNIKLEVFEFYQHKDYLIARCYDDIKVWDLNNNKCIHNFTTRLVKKSNRKSKIKPKITSISFVDNFLLSCNDGEINIFNLDSGKLENTCKGVGSFIYVLDDKQMIIVNDTTVHIMNIINIIN